MASVPPDQLRVLLDEAMRRPAPLRLSYLREACGGDQNLFSEAAALVASESDTALAGPFDPEATIPAEPFTRSARWKIRRRIGAGSFGVVYEVEDPYGSRVALKVLQYLNPESLYRFKREFRSLADVHHRNLVQLYDLVAEDGQWFLTMELVEGGDFLTHVRTASSRGPVAAAATASTDRLVAALRQLTEGLRALHQSGHLHRDVKPANVLVAHDDRVVLLDFGLVVELDAEASQRSLLIAGTPTYMSPEQAAGLSLTPASDFYSVGVMLYEALTGAPPFRGTSLEILTQKQRADPLPPSTIAADVPADLETLCLDLLSRDPGARPVGEAVLQRLLVADDRESLPIQVSTRGRSHPFVGRRQHLAALQEAFDRALEGAPVTVALSGPSGIGKSSLIRRFLERLQACRADVVVLSGRCYERESVPFKALDSVVDALARYLKQLPAHEVDALLPRDMAAVGHVFPMLRDVGACLPQRTSLPPDAQELRRRAGRALRELLGRLSERHPLVVSIDDLQWGDVDSAVLLSEILNPPDAPAMLLVAAFRDIEIETSPFLKAFLTGFSEPGLVPLRVGPLSAEEARDLAQELLARTAHEAADIVRVIAEESGGSPFFIDELVRFSESEEPSRQEPRGPGRSADTDEREATLAHMIGIRISRLPPDAERVLQLVAANGRPLAEEVLVAAGGGSGIEGALAVLRAEHLVRGRETNQGSEFEPYHDRIRQLVITLLPEAARSERHRQLATALERVGGADAELLAEHWLGAGEREKYLNYMESAGRQAEQALAFDRAARLYGVVVGMLPPGSEGRGRSMRALASALANAGRLAEAANVYLELPAASSSEALLFKQKAAEHLLFAGRLDEGLAVVKEVLADIGMRLPEGQLQTLAALAIGRMKVRFRRLELRKPSGEVPAQDLVRVDACWAMAAGLGIVDTMRGAVFQTRHLLLALESGDPSRLHRALCMEMIFAAAKGPRASRRVEYLAKEVAAIGEATRTPYAEAMQALARGVAHYLCGQWRSAGEHLSSAEHLLATSCTGVMWELHAARFFNLWVLYQLGELEDLGERFWRLKRDAQERGDLYARTAMDGFFGHLVLLAGDEPIRAATTTADALRDWGQQGFHLPQLWELWSSIDIALYEGRGTDAHRRIVDAWSHARRSLLLEVQFNRILMLDLRGRAALAAATEAAARPERARLCQEALDSAGQLDHASTPWAEALATSIRAGAAACQGQRNQAVAQSRLAAQRLEAIGMPLVAAAIRYHRGLLIGGADGANVTRQAHESMGSRGIKQPALFARMLAWPVGQFEP